MNTLYACTHTHNFTIVHDLVCHKIFKYFLYAATWEDLGVDVSKKSEYI